MLLILRFTCTISAEKGKVSEKVNLMDSEWEVKTITSTLKNFFR